MKVDENYVKYDEVIQACIPKIIYKSQMSLRLDKDKQIKQRKEQFENTVKMWLYWETVTKL